MPAPQALVESPPLPSSAHRGGPEMPTLRITAAEERFERGRRAVGLVVGPALCLLVWLLPLPALSIEAHRLAAIVTLVVVWWVTEAISIPATALIGTALTVVCGIASATDAFAPFASPTIFLFMGSFMIGEAISVHQLDRRLAFSLLSLPAVRGSLTRIRLALAGLTFLLSGWMSNTATAAMMLPVAVGILAATRAGPGSGPRGRSFATGLLLAIAYAASLGGVMTPVGSPPNLITLGLLEQAAGIRISFFVWMLLVVPIALVCAVVLLVLTDRLFPPGRGFGHAEVFVRHERLPERWTPGQRNCAIAFGLAVTLWIAPGVLALMGTVSSPPGALIASRLDEGVVAILAAGLLFVLPTDWAARRFTLEWDAARRIDWGTILLFGGGLSLGRLMFTTGLAAHVGEGLVHVSGADSLWAITAVAIGTAIVLTEITSNTAATNMLVPVMLAICQATGVNPVPPALGTCLGASMAFMLPISTPPNAIVYGTRLVPITAMIRSGFLLDVIGFGLILVGLRILCPVLGFA